MSIFTNLRSSMAAGGGSSAVQEETLITWDGTNGSTKPTSWSDFTEVTSVTPSSAFYRPVASDDGQKIAIAGAGDFYSYSTDGGSTWANGTNVTGTAGTVTEWVYHDGEFWNVRANGQICRTSDLVNWTNYVVGGNSYDFKTMAIGDINGTETIVAIGTKGYGAWSINDGANWTTFQVGGGDYDTWACSVIFDDLFMGADAWPDASYTTNIQGNVWNQLTSLNSISENDWDIVHDPVSSKIVIGSSGKLIVANDSPVSGSMTWNEIFFTIPGITNNAQVRKIHRDNATGTWVCSGKQGQYEGFVGVAKNPSVIGGSDGWHFITNLTDEWLKECWVSNGKLWVSSGTNSTNSKLWYGDPWHGDKITVTFDPALASSPIVYNSIPDESSSAANDKSLYDALQIAISAGNLSGVTVTYNGGSNNGTGVKVVNNEANNYANITISGSSATASINTYVDN